MMRFRFYAAGLAASLALSFSACSSPSGTTVLETAPALEAAAEQPAPPAPAEPVWAFEDSDIPVDPAFRFGVLDNGMRYILRQNATPEGTALVRLLIGSGSLDESESEQGLAHYLEHMAFNGSTRVPEGEMIKLLEREGLAFGADTNASTGLETTTYKLDLPRNDEDLLETALMLMRETASELTIAPDAVERERGVILAERRDRLTFSWKETIDQFAFLAPGARFAKRLPIGIEKVLRTADAEDLRGFYERTYVPENTVLVIVGDYPIDLLEARVKHWFADWSGGADPVEAETGPLDLTRQNETDIYLDPALSERLTVFRFAPWEDRPDTITNRQQALLRQVGYGIINRRFQKLARGGDAPFRGAGYGTSDLFEDGRTTSLIVDTENGAWERGLDTAVAVLNQALQYGFSEAEVAEQVARIRTSLENAASAAATRSNGALTSAALRVVTDERVPSTPQSALERFENFASAITAEASWQAVLDDAAELDNPLIRLRGRTAPEGGAEALRSAWDIAGARPVAQPDFAEAESFAYTEFGAPGTVVSDTVDERFGFRLIRFANGVRLNLKQTDINEDRIRYRLLLDGGELLDTRDDPLKTSLVASMPSGGLGKHSQDELATVLAGRSVGLTVRSDSDAFRMSGTTTPRDLGLQMQLLAAALTDPGYRPEGEERFRRSIADVFARLNATPGAALGNSLGGILSDNDPRFTLQSLEDYQALTFAQLADAIGERLERGAIEVALVGDLDEEAAIAAVADTLGALPPREAEFLPRITARERAFTSERGQVIVRHSGEPDQALIHMTWPTRDDSDLTEALQLSLLARIVRLELQGQLREDLGKTYSPSANSAPSRVYPEYGVLSLAASVDVADVEETRAAIAAMLSELRGAPVEQDTLDRARQPLIETYDNLLKSLGGWMTLADRAQSEADRLERFSQAPDVLTAITPESIRAVAERYLAPEDAVEVLVLPEDLPETEAGPEPEGADPA